jgi:hypothetical protein
MSAKKKGWLLEIIAECCKRYDELPDWKKTPQQEHPIDPPIYRGGKFDQ